MFGKLGSAFNSVVDKTKNAFSFGNKGPELAKVETLPSKVDPRPEIHNKVSEVMLDKSMDGWATGDGWKQEDRVASTPGRLDNVTFDLPGKDYARPDLAVFQQSAFKAETPDEIGADWMEGGRLLKSVLPGPNHAFGNRMQAAQPEVHQSVPSFTPAPAFRKAAVSWGFSEAPERPDTAWKRIDPELSTEPAKLISILPKNGMLTLEQNRQVAPPTKPSEGFGRESVGALRMRVLAAVAVLMATVGGVAQATSVHHHSHKADRSYSVDDITPMTNEQASASEAQRAKKQKAQPPIEVAQL